MLKSLLHKYRWSGILLCLLLLSSTNTLFANAAQPGIWSTGGTVFTMLYPEDSLTFKKVKMQQEAIFIQLYKGFAVVKGKYIFRNTTNKKLNFKMGYPINGIYSGGETQLNQILIDSLSQFKISDNGMYLPIIEQQNKEYGNFNQFSNNWKVWQMIFNPNEIKTVEVYFLENNNNAQIRNGYNLENKNAFIYLLESGSVWQNPIEKGDFYIQLMDGLTPKNVKGISLGFGFRYNELYRIYAGSKVNFSSAPKDNLVITYNNHIEDFAFDEIVIQSENLFAKIDDLCSLSLKNISYKEVQIGDPYKVKKNFWSIFPSLLMLFVISAPFIIGIMIVTIFIWAIIKWIKVRKN
jgi:hypothetical protein